MRPKGSPPGFEGPPRYTYRDIPHLNDMSKAPKILKSGQSLQIGITDTDTANANAKAYAQIQSICANKMKIYLPVNGFAHAVMENENETKVNLMSVFEYAYRAEFTRKTKNSFK